MGFFKNLFEKKTCDICGQEIGLLGNRKLEDGNCCKSCAKKLSPWFTERKHSTIEEIKEQLADREANKSRVAAFHETRSFGKSMNVLVDENARKFIVTAVRDLQEENPDVLSFDQVTACDLDVKESRNEIYRKVRDSEGNTRSESYSPRRYHYSYDFEMTLRLQHPYIDEIEFSLSCGSFRVEAQSDSSFLSALLSTDSDLPGSTNPPTMKDRLQNDDYARYDRWAKELREILLSGNPANSENSQVCSPASAAPAADVCPFCGARVAGGKFCENCGGKLRD